MNNKIQILAIIVLSVVTTIGILGWLSFQETAFLLGALLNASLIIVNLLIIHMLDVQRNEHTLLLERQIELLGSITKRPKK